MQEDIIYVVYFDGKRYEKEGLKIVYLNKSYAKQIITTESKNKTKDKYDEEVTSKAFKYWYELTEELQRVRRRHTRSTRDWSSDVCSSDLDQYADGKITVEEFISKIKEKHNIGN